MVKLVNALDLCTNLRTFTCTPNILPALLVPLKKHELLQGIRVNATLTMQQAKILTSLTKIQSLALDACSWNMVDALPDWSHQMSATLTTLTLHVSLLILLSIIALDLYLDNTRTQRAYPGGNASQIAQLDEPLRHRVCQDRARHHTAGDATYAQTREPCFYCLGTYHCHLFVILVLWGLSSIAPVRVEDSGHWARQIGWCCRPQRETCLYCF